MKVLIDIPENDYYLACKYPNALIATYAHYIKDGTVLPKGHGRLIDADEEIKYARKWIKHPNQYISQRNKDFIYYLEKAETVIPADK